MQLSYNPLNYAFQWTPPLNPENPRDMGGYEWNRKEGHKLAKAARDLKAAELKKEGYTVTRCSIANQLVRKGGIGTGHPDIEGTVTAYIVNYRRTGLC